MNAEKNAENKINLLMDILFWIVQGIDENQCATCTKYIAKLKEKLQQWKKIGKRYTVL